jgi:pimeloyl-ACP methyl ester carboxylesterase/quinol monooxygenase YgiN
MAATSPESAQVMLVVHLAIRPDAREQMLAALEELVESTRRWDRGVVRFEVGLDPDDDTRVVGYEIWASQEALDEHASKQHTLRFKRRADELAADPGAPLQAERWRPMRREFPAEYVPPPDALRAAASVPAGFRSERHTVADTTLHCVTGGSGPLVVLLHGFPNTWYAWRDVMPRLAESHTVLAVDLRGLGDSDAGEEPNDVPTGANDLALLLAEIGAEPAFVAGQDWGGSTAFALAAGHPAAVRSLAVIEALPSGPWTRTDSARASTWFAGLHQVPDLPEALVRGRERTYLEWFYRAYSATPGVPDRRAVDEYLRTYSRPGAMASAFARYRGTEREIAHNAGRTLELPVLAVGSERVFGAAVAENLRHAAPHADSVVFDGCGHYVSEERPAELAEALLRFFDGGSIT